MREAVLLSLAVFTATAQTTTVNPPDSSFNFQVYQRPEACLPCHQRQYDELHSAVKAGYRSVSPLMNGLELSANFLNGGLLRPVYADSNKALPDGTALTSNMFTAQILTNNRQVQAGFCFTCHNANVERMGDNPKTREVPEPQGVLNDFRPDLIRPLRDYYLVDANGNQMLPDSIGGPAPAGAHPSLGASGITCDVCHNVAGPDLNRSFQHDGFANTSLLLNESMEKLGPFLFPVTPKNTFHLASADANKISFLRSSALCNGCHDVRVPLGAEGPGDLQHFENNVNLGAAAVTYFRLENLSTEWQTGDYNSAANPFKQVVRCQDCHMSTFPFSANSTYQIGDMKVTSPTPGVFAQNYAAVPGISADGNYPLMLRSVVSHNFTGVDVPIVGTDELQARLGDGYPDAYASGTDEYGIPKALGARRIALLNAATRISLSHTDASASPGQTFNVRAETVALTGHRFPAGFSQERTTYIQLTVTDDNGFLLYQSGYKVDKRHAETGELQPDGNLDDEDLEHVHAIVDPGSFVTPYATGPANNGHTNQVFETGPDAGPEERVYAGRSEGLVLFRNELTRIFLPGQSVGRQDAEGNPVVATAPHYEETFSAAFANTVDNFRSLRPLHPRTFNYEIKLPSQQELDEMGVQLKSPLHVHAQINYEHFPPLFMRFLARTTGPNGPAGHDLNLVTEQSIDTYLRETQNISADDFTVELQ